jgi:hypothetical protein
LVTNVCSALIKPCCPYWLIEAALPEAVLLDVVVVLAGVALLVGVVAADVLAVLPVAPLLRDCPPAWRNAPNKSCRKACKSCPTAALDAAPVPVSLAAGLAPAAVLVLAVVATVDAPLEAEMPVCVAVCSADSSAEIKVLGELLLPELPAPLELGALRSPPPPWRPAPLTGCICVTALRLAAWLILEILLFDIFGIHIFLLMAGYRQRPRIL